MRRSFFFFYPPAAASSSLRRQLLCFSRSVVRPPQPLRFCTDFYTLLLLPMGRKQESKKIRRIMNIISEVTPEVLSLILSKLSFINLLNCKLVCKDWNTSISSLKYDSNVFILQKSLNYLHCVDLDPKHLKGMNTVASFKLPPKWTNIQIANSCNGLLCMLHRRRTERVAILNPMTNEYLDVLPRGDRDRIYRYGLGFSLKTKQYKVVRCSFKNLGSLVEIIGFGGSTLLTSQWRNILSFDSRRIFRLEFHGVYFNGAMYWLGEDVGNDDDDHAIRRPKRNVMWRMKVEDERFEEIWCPPGEDIYSLYCGVCNGSLYLSHFKKQGFEYHVWKMDEGGLWNREFVIGTPSSFFNHWLQPITYYHFQIMKICEDGKFLCLVRLIHLVLYDPKTNRFEKLDHEEGIKSFMFIHQMNSLEFRYNLHNILAGDAA